LARAVGASSSPRRRGRKERAVARGRGRGRGGRGAPIERAGVAACGEADKEETAGKLTLGKLSWWG